MPPLRREPFIRAALLLGACLTAACVPDAPSTSAPADRFSLTLAWDAPDTDARGDPLDDLAGYRLYYGSSTPLTRGNATRIEVGAPSTFTVEGLGAGRWYFAVSAVDHSGNESELSGEVSAEVGSP